LFYTALGKPDENKLTTSRTDGAPPNQSATTGQATSERNNQTLKKTGTVDL